MLIQKDSPPTCNLKMENYPFSRLHVASSLLQPHSHICHRGVSWWYWRWVLLSPPLGDGDTQVTIRLQGNAHQTGKYISLCHSFSNDTLRCKISLYLGDPLHAADLEGDFSLIKLQQQGLKEPPQGPAGKAQQDIAQSMRMGHFLNLECWQLTELVWVSRERGWISQPQCAPSLSKVGKSTKKIAQWQCCLKNVFQLLSSKCKLQPSCLWSQTVLKRHFWGPTGPASSRHGGRFGKKKKGGKEKRKGSVLLALIFSIQISTTRTITK